MNIKLQVASLKLSGELWDLRVRKDSYFKWVKWYKDDPDYVIDSSYIIPELREVFSYYPAYSVAELGEMLGKKAYEEINK